MRIQTFATLLLVCGTYAYDNDNPKQLTVVEVDKFLQGFLFALTKKEYTGLETCISDVQMIGNDVIYAVNDFKQSTFDGVK